MQCQDVIAKLPCCWREATIQVRSQCLRYMIKWLTIVVLVLASAAALWWLTPEQTGNESDRPAIAAATTANRQQSGLLDKQTTAALPARTDVNHSSVSQSATPETSATKPSTASAPTPSNLAARHRARRKSYQQQRSARLTEAELAQLRLQQSCREVPTSIGAFAKDVKNGDLIVQQWSQAMQQAMTQGNAAVLALIDECQRFAQANKAKEFPRIAFSKIDWTLYPELVSELPRSELKALKDTGHLPAMQLDAEYRLDGWYAYLQPSMLDAYADLRMIQILGGRLSPYREQQLAETRAFVAPWRIQQLEAQAIRNAKDWQ